MASTKPQSGWSAKRRRMIRDLFPTVPYPRHLGMEIKKLAEGEAQIAITARDELRQYQGIIHGGALASVADTAATICAMTVIPEGWDVITIEFKLNFLKALQSGRAVAIGKVIRSGKRVTVAQVDVHGSKQDGLIATGMFTMLNFPVAGAPEKQTP